MGRLATSVVMALVACGVALFAPIEHPQVKQMQAEAHLKLEPVVAWAKEQYSVLETKVKAVQAGSTASRSPAPVSTSAKVFISPAADADEVAACRLSGKVRQTGSVLDLPGLFAGLRSRPTFRVYLRVKGIWEYGRKHGGALWPNGATCCKHCPATGAPYGMPRKISLQQPAKKQRHMAIILPAHHLPLCDMSFVL